ncbi:hypothetical protein D9757_005762 [Collybiopsis confluens]|uniref:Uncharacterized protein n=1 Tax=Collybiopsis confluens TaxID=2823264 RepID=A0A8H5HQH9_9AGAR|nr:hypothetical protein D9757_005762 [Collybiopsis confluens]
MKAKKTNEEPLFTQLDCSQFFITMLAKSLNAVILSALVAFLVASPAAAAVPGRRDITATITSVAVIRMVAPVSSQAPTPFVAFVLPASSIAARATSVATPTVPARITDALE